MKKSITPYLPNFNSGDYYLIIKIIERCMKNFFNIAEPIIICGKSGSGKNRFFKNLRYKLGNQFPFSDNTNLLNSAIEKDQLEELFKLQKKSIGIRISEYIEYYEGEVNELTFAIDPSNKMRKDFNAIIVLKTLEGRLKLNVSGIIYNELVKKKIKIGNVIRIIPDSCSVQNLGESFNYIKNNSIVKLNFFTLPKGRVFKKKILTRELTIYDFEFENFKNKKEYEFLNIDRTIKLIEDTETLLWKYNQFGKANIIRGILFINNMDLLSINSLSFLFKNFNNWLSPVTILSTNKIQLSTLTPFSLDSFRLNNLFDCFIIPFKNSHKTEALKLICLDLLKEKKFISGAGIKKLKNLLKEKKIISSCISLISISGNAILRKNLTWICINTLNFFNFLILNNFEFQTINCLKNISVKIHKSL